MFAGALKRPLRGAGVPADEAVVVGGRMSGVGNSAMRDGPGTRSPGRRGGSAGTRRLGHRGEHGVGSSEDAGTEAVPRG